MEIQLTTEQQFKLTIIKRQLDNLSLDEAKKYILELVEQSMLKDQLVREWMRK